MANPAVIKAAAALLSDERTRKGIGWIIAAIISPLIVLLALLCSLSAGSSHNASVIELCFNGGALPADTPAEYVAYIEDIVNAEMERAADYIIQHGINRTESGSWCAYFEELEERLGLNIQEGNGLDAMLRSALERRPEIASVDMRSGCITAEYRPEFCRQLQSHTGETAPDIRLKDILPLLKGGGMTFLCHKESDSSVLAENLRLLTVSGQQDHEALLNARVSEICPSPEGVEIVLTGVEPEELVRFKEDCEAFQQAEQAMGPTMA